MAVSKSVRKTLSRTKRSPAIVFAEKRFLITEEDMNSLTMRLYFRASYFKFNEATYSDRTTFLIRVESGLEALKYFEPNEAIQTTLEAARELLMECRDRELKRVRDFTEEEYDLLYSAISFVHQMFDHCSIWEQAQATKAGEDKYLIGSSNIEYVLLDEY